MLCAVKRGQIQTQTGALNRTVDLKHQISVLMGRHCIVLVWNVPIAFVYLQRTGETRKIDEYLCIINSILGTWISIHLEMYTCCQIMMANNPGFSEQNRSDFMAAGISSSGSMRPIRAIFTHEGAPGQKWAINPYSLATVLHFYFTSQFMVSEILKVDLDFDIKSNKTGKDLL